MFFSQKLYCGIISLLLLIPAKAASAVSVFTDSSLLSESTVIDFEPNSSGNTITEINQYLGTDATLSFGGAGARIDNLSDNERTVSFRVNPGADGRPISGVWGFEGGVLGESFLTLTFAPGHFQEAVGSFWGGVASSNARTVVTLADGSTFTTFLKDSLPLVPDSAPDTEGINVFLGIDSQGQLIQQVKFFNNNDLYLQDNITFGSLSSDATSVPEPASALAVSVLWVAAMIQKLKSKV